MKKVHLLFIALLFTAFSAGAQTPLEFNDKLASITDSLYSKGQQWGLAFNDANRSGDYSKLKNHSANMLAFIDQSIASVKTMKDVKQSKPLRMAMLDLLSFEKKMITEGFAPFEKFTSSTERADVEAALEKLKASSADEGVYISKMGAAQELYAAQNGFKIEAAPDAGNDNHEKLKK